MKKSFKIIIIIVCTITELLKKSCKDIDPAILDGANDVGMIQVCTLAGLVKKSFEVITLA